MTTGKIGQMTKFRRLAEQYAKGGKLLTTEEKNALMLRRFYGCETDPNDHVSLKKKLIFVKRRCFLRLAHCLQ